MVDTRESKSQRSEHKFAFRLRKLALSPDTNSKIHTYNGCYGLDIITEIVYNHLQTPDRLRHNSLTQRNGMSAYSGWNFWCRTTRTASQSVCNFSFDKFCLFHSHHTITRNIQLNQMRILTKYCLQTSRGRRAWSGIITATKRFSNNIIRTT